ncbi:MAG: MoxR family ATPase [Bacillota bacterium]|nr:MoxR family ATPase [Bacillota bacterium]
MEAVQGALRREGYVAEASLATAIYLTLALERPLFLEGEPGVGKTEVAKVLADALARPLIRLQCYEGIDRQSALYEWNFPKQMLHIRLAEAFAGEAVQGEGGRRRLEEDLFSREFLLRRPLLAAIDPEGPAPVLLIDEVDRSDEEFEAFLLELLSDFQVTIPEMGTVRAAEKPVVILTSNRTREVHDALKRRCLYHWIDYHSFAKELEIVMGKVPHLPPQLAARVCQFAQKLREEPLFKKPGVAETLHWAEALLALGARQLEPQLVEETLGCLLKYRDDLEMMTAKGEGSPEYRKILQEIEMLSL